MAEWEDKPAAVIDNGTGFIKCGFAGVHCTDDSLSAPSAIFESCVGYPKTKAMIGGRGYYVGQDAAARSGTLICKYPLDHGMVQNWDDMEKLWQHTFDNELRVVVDRDEDPDVSGVLMTKDTSPTKNSAERMTQIM